MSLILWNKLDNTRTTNASEIGTNLTESGAPSYTAMMHRGGIDCDATTKFADITNYTAMNSNQWGIGLWLRPHFASTSGTQRHIMEIGTAAAGTLWFSVLFAANSIYIFAGDNFGNHSQIRTNGETWAAEELFHLMMIADDTGSPRVKIYFNGNLSNTTIIDNDWSAVSWPGTNPFIVGRNPAWGAGTTANSVIDDIRVWDSAAESVLAVSDRSIEGLGGQKQRTFFTSIAITVPTVVPASCSIALPQVLLDGHDLIKLGYVDKVQSIREFKTFRRDKLIQNNYSLNINNFDEFFSLDNPISMFNNIKWQFTPISVIDEFGDTVWTGLVEDISRDHERKSARLVSISNLKKFADQTMSYESSNWETASAAIKNIFDAAGFTDYDPRSFSDSDTQLTEAGSLLKVNFNPSDNVTVQQAVEKLAEFGCGDIYSHNGTIYFKHFQVFTGGTSVSLSDKDLFRAPRVRNLMKEITNDYRIFYDGSATALTDATGGNIGSVSRSKFSTRSLPEMGGGTGDQIVFKNKTSAQYIGECYINRSHFNISSANVRAIQAIDFAISIENQEWIDLNTFFRLTFTDEGWTNKLFEVFMFERNYRKRTISITAYEVFE